MADLDFNQLVNDISRDEGYKPLLYTDTTGHSTIGYGWNVQQRPISPERAKTILSWFVQDTWTELVSKLPWLPNHPEPIQRSLADMAYNLGVTGLLKFTTFVSMIQNGNYSGAADDLLSTLWAKQVGTRASRIYSLIKGSPNQ